MHALPSLSLRAIRRDAIDSGSLTRLAGLQTEMCSACSPKRKTCSPGSTGSSPQFRNFADTSVGIVAALWMNRHDTQEVPRIKTCCNASNGQPATLGTVSADSGNSAQLVNAARSRRAAWRTRVTTTGACRERRRVFVERDARDIPNPSQARHCHRTAFAGPTTHLARRT